MGKGGETFLQKGFPSLPHMYMQLLLRVAETILGKHSLPFGREHETDELRAATTVAARGRHGDGIQDGLVSVHHGSHLHLVAALLGVGTVNETGVDLATAHIIQSLTDARAENILGLQRFPKAGGRQGRLCLLYTSDAADDLRV